MKVLIVSGSPRIGGNSDLLCGQFAKGAKEAGHDVEIVYLGKKKIAPCLGCETCNKTGICVQKDDMKELLEKQITADVIVLATPVYFYCMDAQMKIFIDRSLPIYTKIKNKDFYYIVTCADTERKAVEGTILGLHGYIACLPGATEKGTIYGTGVWQRGDILSSPAMKEAYEMGLHIKSKNL